MPFLQVKTPRKTHCVQFIFYFLFHQNILLIYLFITLIIHFSCQQSKNRRNIFVVMHFNILLYQFNLFIRLIFRSVFWNNPIFSSLRLKIWKFCENSLKISMEASKVHRSILDSLILSPTRLSLLFYFLPSLFFGEARRVPLTHVSP